MDRLPSHCVALAMLLLTAGCATLHHSPPMSEVQPPVHGVMPRETSKVVMPEYVIEIPDILLVEATQVIPKPPYRLRTGDSVLIQVQGVNPDMPINGEYPLGIGGKIDFGPEYGSIAVAGMSTEEATAAITRYLQKDWKSPVVTLSLVQMAGMQQIAGEHSVRPDGTISLGSYGSVSVVGLTLTQAKTAIESHLSQHLEDPEISVDVSDSSSKVYYVVMEGPGMGDMVMALPITGNETVLDAMAAIGGTSGLSSKHIWIARPTPYADQIQILPVDWVAIAKQGSTVTNYQIMPGDRIFIAADQFLALDANIRKITAPMNAISGFTMSVLGTMRQFSGQVLGGGRGYFGGGVPVLP